MDKLQIVSQYIERLKRQGVRVDYVTPDKGQGKDRDNVKLWRVEGIKPLLSINQLYRLATAKCPVCRKRFVRRVGKGRKRRYCSRTCQNTAYRKRKMMR